MIPQITKEQASMRPLYSRHSMRKIEMIVWYIYKDLNRNWPRFFQEQASQTGLVLLRTELAI